MMRSLMGFAAAVLLLASCSPAPKSDVAASTPAMPVDEVMAHVMDPGAFAFWGGWGTELTAKGERDLSPQTDADWKKVEDGAATVVVASSLLMTPAYARAPTAQWNGYAAKVNQIALAGKSAADRKDAASMYEIGRQLDDACGACHKAFQPKPPAGT